jgi:peptidyl-prolyl cis-trans isomerase SurA
VIKSKKIFITILITLFSLSNANAEIKDGIFIVVGNKAITKSDIVNEIKIILLLNNLSYSEDKREQLQQMAVKSYIERTIKEIEISKSSFLKFSIEDVNNELDRLAKRINMDVDTLKNVATSNGLDFDIIRHQVETSLLWNSLIFYLYKDRISINSNEIEEQLEFSQSKKDYDEYLISEIIIKTVSKEMIESKIEEIKNMISIEGFENTAMSLSISESAVNGGDLGWVSENSISKKLRTVILNTNVGEVSDAILLPEGILFYKVQDKRKAKKETDLNKLKENLVRTEKSKILNMYALSHYDNLRRSVAIKFFTD